MPTGFDELTAAAAAGQFIQQGLGLIRWFYSNIVGIAEAPENVRRFLAQIQHVIGMSQLIIQNPALQTHSIATCLQSCLMASTKLESTLKDLRSKEGSRWSSKNWRRAFQSWLKTVELRGAFGALESQKKTLVLALQDINSSELREVCLRISDVRRATIGISASIIDPDKNVHKIANTLDHVSIAVDYIKLQSPDLSRKLTPLCDQLNKLILDVRNLRERVVAELSEASQASGGFNSYPIYRTTNFVGREKCMIDLRNMLLKDSSLSKCVVVHALGGQGKSCLASEYCHRSAGSLYHTILWVDASSVNSIQQSFQTFFNKVIPPANWSQISGDEKMASVLGYFERMRKPWLIVFDNYDCPDSILLQSFMPTNTAGSIIITSRHAQVTGWQTSQGVIELGPLDQAAANRLFIESSGADPSCENKAEIDKIVRLLSNHALAIHQAGKLWSRTKQPLSQFSEFYTNQKQKILSTTLSEVEYNRRLTEESQSLDVFATWELSVAQLGGDQTIKGMKEDMLTILGFWERQTVSEEPFKVFCNQIQAWDTPEKMLQSPGRFIAAQLGHWGHELFFKYISELSDLGLITGYWLDDGLYRVSFHPLVRDWVRLRLPTSIAQEYRILAVEIMTEMLYITKWMSGTVSIPSDSDWSEYIVLFDESDRKILTTYLDVESNLAHALRESGDCGRSLKFSERLLSVMTRVLGAESKQRIEAEFNMCLSMIAAAADAADFANAEKRLRSLQDLSSSLYEPQDQVVRFIRTQISLCRMKVHDVGGAEILLKEQLLDDQRYFGDQSRNIWELKSLLATVLLHQNKFDEAGILFLEVKTQTSDLNPQFQGSWFRTFLWEYGTFLRLKRDFAASEEPLRQSWMAMLNHDGADHPNTTACLSSLLETTFKLHKFHVAEILAKDLIIAYSRRLGPNDWNIVHVKAILIHCLQGQMKTEEAKALFRKIVTSDITDRRADGQDHPPSCIDSFVTMGDVAILCREYSIRGRDLGLLQKAEDLTGRVLRGLIQLASKEDSRTKQMQLELNYIQQLKGQFSAGRC